MDEQRFWDAVFARPDPWGYDDLYERTKRAHTLEILPQRRFARVLEIGCAEGHFTLELAEIANTLVAIDISSTALSRAQARCRSFSHVRFVRGNAFTTLPAGEYDLIVCSEVLYYARNRYALRSIARRISSKLQPGGHLVVAHALNVSDKRGNTGFDCNEIGGLFIGRSVARIRNLQSVRELHTELYRIQLFEKTNWRSPGRRTEILKRDAACSKTGRVSRLVKWGGCDVTDGEARHLWRSTEISILMYHRVADTGPAALSPYRVSTRSFERQLAYLQRHGFRSLSIEEAFNGLQSTGFSPRGRLVVFTFDDAYKDFYHSAWPLLRAHGFSATVFVPTAFVGQSAEWDRSYGESAALMTWEEIRAVQREGAHIGSHAATHRRLTALARDEIRNELCTAKHALEDALGTEPDVLSYPFADVNDAVRGLAAECGYRYAVVGEGGCVKRGDDPHLIPRREVFGHDDMQQFISKLGRQKRSSVTEQLTYYWRRLQRDRRTYMDQ